jgi:predicted HicB family RNase H-like nuclease
MKLLKHKGFLGNVEVSLDDNCLYGKLLFINDLITYEAETPAQLEEEFKSAVEDYLETCREFGKEPNRPFSGTFNVRIGPELHKKAATFAAKQEKNLNDIIKVAIEQYVDNPKQILHQHVHRIEFTKVVDMSQTEGQHKWDLQTQSLNVVH